MPTSSSLDPTASLAIAYLSVYTPLFLISLPVSLKHLLRSSRGAGGQHAWLYLPLLSALRLASASIQLYTHVSHDFSQGLEEAAVITSAIGTAPLLLLQLEFVRRANSGLEPRGRGIGDRGFRLIAFGSLVSLVLGIVGGVEAGEGNMTLGKGLRGASAVLFLAVFGVQSLMALRVFVRLRDGGSDGTPQDARLVRFALAVVPFVAVRLIYTICTAFAGPGSEFYFLDVNVYAEAFMLFLMEVIAIAIYLVAGWVTPAKQRGPSSVLAEEEMATVYTKPERQSL